MAVQKTFYNPELEQSASYTEQWVIEFVQVLDQKQLRVKHHYWLDANGVKWTDFDHPFENLFEDFTAYRLAVHYLQPSEIQTYRQQYRMNLSDLAQVSGLSVAVLQAIEKNERLQTSAEDAALRRVFDAAETSRLEL
ncbi:transcriptional regulator [Lactiplantibacillus fabifermentans]|uniref:HTH cro/C1-type domain-containing protein n=2 Tax=Lactiplantibacillus fabifermentans TaxID=483011 RepID=A0A0R2NIA8_9LACO|nr:transcriptional regulator [Lactiplantibacillus fabifermentans]ETY74272.1 hypothetical protein LFAB_08070 [Lactiplantibacillus fabifermentans T30PCM01]KRO23693.1 hypothetical protein DY78_GL001730 [Lactiplantibacillus fabifermentans DSM 21115]